jgi:hypothetical protein
LQEAIGIWEMSVKSAQRLAGKSLWSAATMKQFVLVTLLPVILVAGCSFGPEFGGGTSASYGNADKETVTVVVTQRDPQRDLLFAITWKARHGAGGMSYSSNNLLSAINGHSVRPRVDQRGVYALQPDHSLKPIPLTEQQMKALFRELENGAFHTSHSELWQKQIAPHLVIVESAAGT